MKDWLTIGLFSKRTGVSARALRLYEKMGLIASVHRGENGYRYYREDQIPKARKVRDLKGMGFSLVEVKSLLDSEEPFDKQLLERSLKRRLDLIAEEEQRLCAQKNQIRSILLSVRRSSHALSERERKYVMELFKKVRILVTGIENLEGTATYIQEYLTRVSPSAKIVPWNDSESIKTSKAPIVIVVPESRLDEVVPEDLNPDVIVIKNISDASEKTKVSYLRLFADIDPNLATILNADDRASIEIAKSPLVRKGKIFYFSKNSGLKDQIEKIGGAVSDGEEITMYGFNRQKSGSLNIKIRDIKAYSEEVALLAALTAVMDIGIKAESLSLVVESGLHGDRT